jgi:hypothetical protein
MSLAAGRAGGATPVRVRGSGSRIPPALGYGTAFPAKREGAVAQRAKVAAGHASEKGRAGAKRRQMLVLPRNELQRVIFAGWAIAGPYGVRQRCLCPCRLAHLEFWRRQLTLPLARASDRT